VDVVGHEDIAPARKNDPGPAFPMEKFRQNVMGAAVAIVKTDETKKTPSSEASAIADMGENPEEELSVTGPEQFVTTANLNIRIGPGKQFSVLSNKSLPKGTVVRLAPQPWFYVQAESESALGKNLTGWVHSAYLAPLSRDDAQKDVDTESSRPDESTTPDDISSQADEEADLRIRMAARILNFEARRDSEGHIMVYNLPSADGGGSYEVAGINQRYHPEEAAKLREMIENCQYSEAEQYACAYYRSIHRLRVEMDQSSCH
jgi:hypothetical protein